MTTASGFQPHLSEALRLALLYRLACELNADLDTHDVLRRVLNTAAEVLATPHASIIALRHKALQDVYALGGGKQADPFPALKQVLAEGLAGFVLHNYRTVIVNDVTANPLWRSLPDEPFSPQVGSALCMPLIHSGDVVGIITLAHPACNYFTAEAVQLVNTISEMGAAALANTLLLAELRGAQGRYHALFDDVIVPIILTDLNGGICAVNRSACAMLGYHNGELLRHNISMVHRMGAGPLGGERYDHLIRGREVRFRSVVWTKAGSEIPVQVYAKRLRRNGGGDYIQWIEYDVSSALELDRLRQDLTAMVYHDMRGPLGNIYTSVAALRKLLKEHPNPNVAKLLDVAARSEQRARHMVESLLDVQRLEDGKRFLKRTTTMINTIIQEVVQDVQPLAEEKRVRVRLSLADDLPPLYVDADMIGRVVLNLIDNAIKYAPDYGLVTVSTASSGEEVFIRIKDTGPGIPREALDCIFDKFARVKQRNMPAGVGLGLAFCKLTVDAHGGRIWVRSNQKNGSIFTFALPIEAPATRELPLVDSAAP
ncbi:MAG: GAF domain-containing protein [Anaerolineae bacterium]|nr:GAF domain-containing protein [Anaerolineae bacterium]